MAPGAITAASVEDPARLGFDAARLTRMDAAFQGFVDAGKLPGAVVLIARHGKLAYCRAFGYADREAKVAMAPDAIFRIASMTKPVTSVAAMMLVEEGRLDLAAPVASYLPEFAGLKVLAGSATVAPHRPMTVQDLMRHTSGLVYGYFGDTPVHAAYREVNIVDRRQTLAEMVTKLAHLPLAHQPGEVWEYSISTDVLGRIVEIVSGATLDRCFAERITGPLGMSCTAFAVAERDWGRIAEPQIDPATGRRPPMADVTKPPAWLSGGGGLVSTAADYLRFCEMLLGGGQRAGVRLLAPSSIALMTADALPPGIAFAPDTIHFGDLAPTPGMGQGFGLGFAVRTAAGRNPLPGSVGSYYWVGATGTCFYVDPNERLVVILLIQVAPLDAGSPFRHAVRALAYQALTGAPA